MGGKQTVHARIGKERISVIKKAGSGPMVGIEGLMLAMIGDRESIRGI